MFFLFFLIIFLASNTITSIENGAQEITSTYLAASNAFEFNDKLGRFLSDAHTLSLAPVTQENKNKAKKLYNHFSTFMELYSKKYPIESEMDIAAYRAFRFLARKFFITFALQLPPIEDIFAEISKQSWVTKANLLDFILSDPGRPLTQTEAYLSKVPLQKVLLKEENILSSFPGTPVVVPPRYYPLIIEAVKQERSLRNYFVLYHGQSKLFMLFYDIIAAILRETEKGIPSEVPFEYLRIPGSPQFEQRLTDFLREGFDTDHETAVKDVLLSVNFSLFGNSDSKGESSFSFFMRDSSVNPPTPKKSSSKWQYDPKDLLSYLFEKLNIRITDIQLDRLENLYRKYLTGEARTKPSKEDTSEGTLLQIFIPEEKINDYVFLSLRFGSSLKDSYRESIRKLSNLTTYEYLSSYRNNPESLDSEAIDTIQGRLLLTNDFLLNPKSGVRIYRYSTIPSARLTKYKKELNAIVKEIVAQSNQKSTSFMQLIRNVLNYFN